MRKYISLIATACGILALPSMCFAQYDGPMYKLPEGVQTRWASMENQDGKKGEGAKTKFGRKGCPCTGLNPGQSIVLAHAENTSGTVRRIWITISDRNPEQLRGLVIRMYWDEAEKPAVEAPLGDFFCQPLGQTAVFENAWFDNPEGRSFNCRIPMPFKKGFKITVTNESNKPSGDFYYDVDYTIGDKHSDETGYLHAYFNHENPTTIRKDFEILPKVTGKGRFLGCCIGVNVNRKDNAWAWWGEGEFKTYIDGDTDNPTLCGTGTEDYASGGYGMGVYSHLWHGCTIAELGKSRYAFYRMHGPDPIYFDQDIRVTIQQIGYYYKERMIGHLATHPDLTLLATGDGKTRLTPEIVKAGQENGTFERSDDWCATAYFYLNSPIDDLPAIEPYEKRIAGLLSDSK
jgi:hypothetical protein